MEGGGSPTKTFPCRFCDQVFVTAQALGGHQNCHRHEREAMKKAREEQERLSVLAPPLMEPLLPQTVPTYISNIRNHHLPLGDVSRFHGPTFEPNRMVPKEYYFQPFAHQQQIHPVNNSYFDMKNYSNNSFETPIGRATLVPGHHVGFPSYYEGILGQEKPQREPQIYDFFANESRGTSMTTGVVNQLNTNLSTSPIVGDKAKEGSTIVGPSTSLVMMDTGEATDNKDGNDKTGIELDLTLRL